MNILQKYFNFFILCIVIYLVVDKVFSVEKMSNSDIKKLIEDEYRIDVDSIRNLSKLANDLTTNNKLIIPGGLEIQGPLKVTKDITTDGNGYFGPAFIGKHGKNDSRFAQFCHKNMTSTSQYAFLQGADGKTFINTPNKTIYFRNNNSDKFTMANNGNMNFKGVVTFNNKIIGKNGGDFSGGRYYFTDSEKCGKLRVGCAWGVPGIYAEGGKHLTLGSSAGEVQFQNNSSRIKGNTGTFSTVNTSKVNISGSSFSLLTLNKTNDATNLIEFKHKGIRKQRFGLDGNSKPWYGSLRGWY